MLRLVRQLLTESLIGGAARRTGRIGRGLRLDPLSGATQIPSDVPLTLWARARRQVLVITLVAAVSSCCSSGGFSRITGRRRSRQAP